ncbi:PREDICTED: olfactory receptor 2A12-like [Elephantulus edwardii]|uniref:olfactory receptor 2A12-like n=1 Tax=Elephantulus edwardii TaxID=28737 RepID=UPI0003F07425|nr:PREDICTED: olfactory receptor 2A12-like [Elephantulus edwardii]
MPREQNQSWVSEFILLGFSSDPTSNRIFFFAFLLLYLSSILGNGLIVTLICLDSHLHTPMYFFLCILSLLDMGSVTTTVPQMLVHLLTHSQTISFACCWLQMYMFGAFGLFECIFFVVMAYDRYVAICYPLRYTIILSWDLCTQLAAGTCACGFFLSLIHTFLTMRLPYCGPNIVNHYFCEGPSVRSLACMDTHLIEMVDLVISVFMVVAPLSLIVTSYIRIVLAILKIKSNSGRYKAFSTCVSHLIVVILFYAPASYVYMRPNSSYSSERDKQVSTFYNVFTPLLNPVVYSLRNKDIKGAFLKIIEGVAGTMSGREGGKKQPLKQPKK